MTVDCKFIQENLIEFVYDEITDDNVLNEMKTHIKSCPVCKGRVNSFLTIKNKMQDIMVDFPSDVWEIYIKEIKERLNKKTGFFESFINTLKQIFDLRKIVVAFALIFLLFGSIQIFKIKSEKESNKKIIENMEILENISILEHLDFYEKLRKGNIDL